MNTVRLSDIDLKDGRFSLSYPHSDEKLLWSIRSVGIIQPVVLLDAKPLIPVTGIKRLHCARILRYTSIPALIKKFDEKDALLVAIHDNLARGLNIVEKSHALDKMNHFCLSSDDIFAVMKQMGLHPHEKILASLLAIARSDKPVKEFILKKNLSLKNIDGIMRFEGKERKMIVRSLSGLHLTENMLREILEMLQLVRIRKGSISARDLGQKVSVDEIRTRLKKKTHPILSSLQKRLQRIRSELSLPPGTDIRVDPFFEKEYIDIILKVGSEEEAIQRLDNISELIRGGYVRSILELTKGRIH